MVGVFAAFLCICASINTILPTPRQLGTWGLLLGTTSADIAVLGLILLGIRFLPRMYWRRWTIWLWLVAMLGFVLSASYQAIATVAPALRVPAIVQVASSVQLVSYFLGLLSVTAGQIYSLKARSSHQQASQSAPPQ